jgi:hypothetical protein
MYNTGYHRNLGRLTVVGGHNAVEQLSPQVMTGWKTVDWSAVIGGYALANRLHVSGPLAMVVVGLIIGSHGRALAMWC